MKKFSILSVLILTSFVASSLSQANPMSKEQEYLSLQEASGRFGQGSISMRELAEAQRQGKSNLFIEQDPVVSRDLRRQVVKSMSMRGGGPVERELERNFGDNIQDIFYDEVRRSDSTLADRTLDGVMTYYFISMWQTANQAYTYWPSDEAVRALRKQVLERLSKPNAVPTKPSDLQREAENLMYGVMTMKQVMKNALDDRSEHRFQLISDQAQQVMLEQGFDMRNLVFGSNGLEPSQPKTDGKDKVTKEKSAEEETKVFGFF